MKRAAKLRLAALAVASAWLSIVGCTAVLGLDDKSFDGLGGSSGSFAIAIVATAGSSSSVSAGAGGCSDDVPADAALFPCPGAGCLEIPCGWTGPVFLTDEATTCATEADDFGWTTGPTVFAPSTAGDLAACECGCSNVAPCHFGDLKLFSGDTCTGPFVSTSVDDACTTFAHDGGRSARLDPDLTCFADAGLAKPMIEDAGRLCSPKNVAACGAHGFCVPPSPFDGGVACVTKETADVETCPVGFPKRYLLGNQGFADERECKDCACPLLDAAACVGAVAQLAGAPNCSMAGAKLDAGDCTALDGGAIEGAKLLAMSPLPKDLCGEAIDAGGASGDIEPAKGSVSLYTVCCPSD